LFLVRKFEASSAGKTRTFVFVVIISVSVVHRKHGMDEAPGGNHGRGGEEKMFSKGFPTQPLRTADQNLYGSQTRHGGENHEKENCEARRVLKFSCLHTGLGAGQENS